MPDIIVHGSSLDATNAARHCLFLTRQAYYLIISACVAATRRRGADIVPSSRDYRGSDTGTADRPRRMSNPENISVRPPRIVPFTSQSRGRRIIKSATPRVDSYRTSRYEIKSTGPRRGKKAHALKALKPNFNLEKLHPAFPTSVSAGQRAKKEQKY